MPIRFKALLFGALVCLAHSAFSQSAHQVDVNRLDSEFGAMLPHLVGQERELFRFGHDAFTKTITVQGDQYFAGTEIGLGPEFNGDSCAMCHAYPTAGGSSPSNNPQIKLAMRAGAKNGVPSFLDIHGPTRQVRFKMNHAGNPDGTVHPLFTIAGRIDAPGCNLPQHDFSAEQKNNNLSFRISPPLYGAGLIESIPDSEILSNQARDQDSKRRLGIHGHPNHVGPDGSIGKFGWKAQTTSLQAFTAEAYAVEQGVTNELYPQERVTTVSCRFNATPEDRFSVFAGRSVEAQSNVALVSSFLLFLAPPPSAATGAADMAAGRQTFFQLGCHQCHTPTLVTGESSHAVLSQQQVDLYSDLLVHRMGRGLADGIRQGSAESDEFRTPPLWGLSQRLFFLHDGRTNNLNQAILAHASAGSEPRPSEATAVITRYRRLSPEEKAALLQFLKSL